MNKKLYSTNEAAEYINFSVSALKYHIKQGNIKPQKIGHSLVFTKSQLDNFMSEKRQPGRPQKEQKKCNS